MAEIVEVQGLEDVRQRLVSLPVHLRGKVLYALLRKAAWPIVKAAKANAPVAKKATRRVIPGLIRRTIGVTRSKIKNPSRGEFGVFIQPKTPGSIKSLQRRARKHGKAVNFGDPFYYKFQEFGFHAVGRKRISGGRRTRAAKLSSGAYRFVPGKEFLGKAFAAHKDEALRVINAGIVDAIAKKFDKKV